MSAGNDILYFAYDTSGPMSVTWNDTTYFYVTNLQGDVVAILDVNGTAVVTYTYDAWGRILTTGGTLANSLGSINPLRYRGYVYDTESGLYYLQSRFYDPKMERFLNGDAYATTGQGLLGNNTFVYCANNSVNNIDPNGNRHVAVHEFSGGVPVTTLQIANRPSEQIHGVINGQGVLPYSDTRLILGTYGASGCAYIATYNAMQLIGKPQSLSSVTSDVFWYGSVALGAGGAGPWGTAAYFRKHGVDYTGSFSADILTANIQEGSVIVFTVLNNKSNLLDGWHAMTALYRNGMYWVFNTSNSNTDTKKITSLSDAYLRGAWLYGFRIDP